MESNFEIFLGWQCKCPRSSSEHQYDPAIYEMRTILRKHSLIGYHCTKLTEEEVKAIKTNGMVLQNATSLSKRVDLLREQSLISEDVAQLFKNKNRADDSIRASMLWFCFFEPFLAGRDGIESFFRFWGGEALYCSHGERTVTGNALLKVGTPCIVKARVPISSLKNSYYPDSSMIRAFLLNRGHQIENDIEPEGFSIEDIKPDNIIEIIKYPSEQFVQLTKCNEWDKEIAL